jgi:hypothetical protein
MAETQLRSLGSATEWKRRHHGFLLVISACRLFSSSPLEVINDFQLLYNGGHAKSVLVSL